MEWRCRECGRSYHEPPETCVCGSASVDPTDDTEGGRSQFSLLALRQRLLDPQNADRSLVREEPYVTLLFRALVVASLFGAVLLAALLLV